jgi:hypothetical protein
VKILVCGADDTFFYFRFMFIYFVLLHLFFISFGWFCSFCGLYFIINDLVYFIDWNIITLNGRSIIILSCLTAVLYYLSDSFLLFLLWLFFIAMIKCSVIWILLALFYWFNIYCFYNIFVAWGSTALLVGRSRDRFPVVSHWRFFRSYRRNHETWGRLSP